MPIERILGTDIGKDAFYKTDRNFVGLEEQINSLDAEVDAHKADNVNPHPIYAKKALESWIAATLMNGWTGNLQYAKNELGIVQIKASLTAGTVSAGTVITTLPVGYRPSNSFLIMYFVATNGNRGYGLRIDTTGDVKYADSVAVTGDIIQFFATFQV